MHSINNHFSHHAKLEHFYFLLVLPEPPDINDCFDSYVPETQEFDASNDCRAPESNDNELNDHDGQRWSSSSLGKEEKDVKCTRNGMKEKSAVQLLEGLAKFTSKENYKNVCQVTDFILSGSMGVCGFVLTFKSIKLSSSHHLFDDRFF